MSWRRGDRRPEATVLRAGEDSDVGWNLAADGRSGACYGGALGRRRSAVPAERRRNDAQTWGRRREVAGGRICRP
jgi:hypothetical protein